MGFISLKLVKLTRAPLSANMAGHCLVPQAQEPHCQQQVGDLSQTVSAFSLALPCKLLVIYSSPCWLNLSFLCTYAVIYIVKRYIAI